MKYLGLVVLYNASLFAGIFSYCIDHGCLHHLVQGGEVLLDAPLQRLHLALDIGNELLVLLQQVGHLLLLGALEALQELLVLVVEGGHALLGVLDPGEPLGILHLLLHHPQLLKQLLVCHAAEVLDPLVEILQLVSRRN